MEEIRHGEIILNEEEREIDLKQLLIVVLRRWRLMLLITLICAVAGGIYGNRPVSVIQEIAPEQKTDTAVAESTAKTAQEYETELKNYRADLAYYNEMSGVYEDWIEEDQDRYDAQEEYLQNSFLSRVDPYHVAYSVAEIFILKDETGTAAVTGGTLKVIDRELLRILRMYQASFTSDNLLEECAKRLKTEAQFIRETLGCGVNTDYGYISLSVTGADHAFTEEVLETLLSHLEEIRTKVIEETDAEHEAKVLVRDHYFGVNKGYATDQLNIAQTQFNQAKRIADNQLVLDKMEKPVIPLPPSTDVADALQEEVKEELPQVPAVTEVNSAKRAVKWLLIGLAGGCFLSLFLIAIYYVLSNRPLSAGEIARRYHLRTIGVFPRDTKGKGALDKKLSMLGEDRTFLGMTPEERLSVAAANLSVYAPDAKEMLLVSSFGEGQLRHIAEKLHAALPGISFHCAPSMNENAASLETLRNFRQVILVESPLQSKYAQIDRTMQLLYDWKKEVTGFIGGGAEAS